MNRKSISKTENIISAPFNAKDGLLKTETENIFFIISTAKETSAARKKIHANEISKNVAAVRTKTVK